jgi:hypothetical protein
LDLDMVLVTTRLERLRIADQGLTADCGWRTEIPYPLTHCGLRATGSPD